MAQPFRPNQSSCQQRHIWERSNPDLSSIFTKAANKRLLSNNKPYHTKLISASDAAALLDLPLKTTREELANNGFYPADSRVGTFLYRVKDVVALSKKLGREFIIPTGLFLQPQVVYVGDGLQAVIKLWHPITCSYYNSIFEMLIALGLPVQTMVFSTSLVEKLEYAFLHRAAKLIYEYNKFAKKSGGRRKHIILCTSFNQRATAEKLLSHFNARYPGVCVTIDQEHLYHLRKIEHDRHTKKKDEND